MNLHKLLVVLLWISGAFAENVLVVVDGNSPVDTKKVESVFQHLKNGDKVTAAVIYNDMDRSKKYIDSLSINSKNFSEEKDRFLFRITNLDLNVKRNMALKTLTCEKIIQVEEERTITFDKSDTLFAIDDSGSMDSYKEDVKKDIKNVAKKINFKNSTFGVLVCPTLNRASDGFTHDSRKIDQYLNYKGLTRRTESDFELPCALRTAVKMFSDSSKNQNKIMFYFGDGNSMEDLESVEILREMGVIIIPIAVGSMDKRTLTNISHNGTIIQSNNVNMKTLSTIKKKVLIDKLVYENREVNINIDEHHIFDNLSKVDLDKYSKVYLFSDMTHNVNGFNYQEEEQKVGKSKANKMVLDKYGIDLNKIIINNK